MLRLQPGKLSLTTKTTKSMSKGLPLISEGRFAVVTGTLTRHNIGSLKMTPVAQINYKGTKAVEYTVEKSSANFRIENDEQNWDPVVDSLESTKFNPTAIKILLQLYTLPVIAGMPLNAKVQIVSTYQNNGKKYKTLLETLNMHQMQIDTTAPNLKGYKKLADEIAFTNENTGTLDFKDFTDYMGH